MVSIILIMFVTIIFLSTWFYFELKKTKEQVRKLDSSLKSLVKHTENIYEQTVIFHEKLQENQSTYLHKDNLGKELDAYYDIVEKRIKAKKEEVWKSREKAFSITKE